MTETAMPPLSSAPTPEPALDEGQAMRADIYRLLAHLLRTPPDADLLAWLASLEIEDEASPLAPPWQVLLEAARHAVPATLERAHFQHLVGVIQGEITPYASWYRNGELMDESLVALRRDLRALGLERSDQTRDPEDHLAALCEAMALLIEAGSPDEARFFMAHLAPWAMTCLNDLAQVENTFYAGLGGLGRAFLDTEEARLAAEADLDPVRLVEP